MKREKLINKLKDNVLLFDGAMGTMLYAKGIFINRCFDELNLSMPDVVKEIHQEYINAGADCIETNTFGANRFKLAGFGYGDKTEAINRRGAEIAKEIAGDSILVAGSIGPLGVRVEPWGTVSLEEAKGAFQQQAQALVRGGVDLFVLETFSDLSTIRQAIVAIQEIGDFPIVASMTIDEEGNSLFGSSPETMAQRLEEWGVDVIGINCSVGPKIMLEVLEKLVQLTNKPIAVMPNAGFPQAVEGRNIYLASSEYMAEYARRFIQTGAQIVGGCCGTTPEYIKAMHNAVRSIVPRKSHSVISVKVRETTKAKPVPMGAKSQLGRKLEAGEFVTSVEIVPPRGCDPSKLLDSVQTLKDNHVDSVNIPDGPRALSRMSAQHLSVLIRQKIEMDPILHYTCRDRNLLGMMSDMLGLDAVGVKNLLIITGDPPKMGDYPDSTAVFDVDSIGLINMVNNLNQGIDLGGNKIGKPTGYLIGVGVNPGAIQLDDEIHRFEQKINSGAEFAITQPIFNISILNDFFKKIKHLKIPIIAGIWPIVSLRNAEFMNNEIPGASVPEDIMNRIRDADRQGRALEEGIQIAKETVEEIKSFVGGVQVSAPFGRVSYALEVLSTLK